MKRGKRLRERERDRYRQIRIDKFIVKEVDSWMERWRERGENTERRKRERDREI